MQVLTITGEKGGTGKTTFSTHISALLAARGLRVLLVDYDPQANASLSFGLAPEPGVYDLMVRGRDIFDLLRMPPPERYCPPNTEPRGMLYVLPSNEETHAITTLRSDVGLLGEALEDARDAFDLVVIDTPPSPGASLAFAYHASNYVLIPTQMEYLSLTGVTSTVKAMSRWKGLSLLGIVPNMYRENTVLHSQNLEFLRSAAAENGWPLWNPVPLRIVWAEASQQHCMVYSLEGDVGKARLDAMRLADGVQSVVFSTA